MSERKTVKTWEKTKRQNLLRHKTGGYYARTWVNGKEQWKSLKTKTYSVAEAKLATLQAANRKQRGKTAAADCAQMTFAQAMTIHFVSIDNDPDVKRGTRKYHREVYASLLESWPKLDGTQLRHITEADCKAWGIRHKATASATRFNGTLTLFRRAFAIGGERAVIHADPAAAVKRAAVRTKRPDMPSRAKFAEFITEMRAGGSRDSGNCADLAEAFAYTGIRLGEAAELTWADVHFAKDEIAVKGDPDEATKNWRIRTVPMIPEARQLLERMRSKRSEEPGEAKVFLVHECQKSMDRAAKAVGMKRLTHHGLRHYFTSICLESGINCLTLSVWLGHRDGGATLMKTYAHLLDEHSKREAKRVSFAPIAEPANVLPFEKAGVA